MGLRLQLRKETEARFREAAMKRFGYGRGALSKAAEQAIEVWLSTGVSAPKFEGDPVKAIQGILKELNAGSVELQHSVQKTWAAKVMHDASY
jgi:hypothetical protein